MKKTISVMLALSIIASFFAMCGVTAFAEDDSLSYLTYEISDNEVTITKCDTKAVGDIVIPERINDIYPVTAIGSYAFEACDQITSITIPATIKSIGEYAFDYCLSLTKVYADNPESWLNMELETAASCPTYNCAELYFGNELATEIIIPENITKINKFIFSYCTSIKKVTLHENITEIGVAAFEGCSALESINIPDSVSVIGGAAFRMCSMLKEMHIPYGITHIEGDTFARCYALESITIPDSVRWIGWFAFEECTELKEIVLGNGITRIFEEGFSACMSLKKVIFPESLVNIDLFSFYGCQSLTEIVVPSTVKNFRIDEYSSITDIYYTGSESDWKKINITDDANTLSNIKFHYNYKKPADDNTEPQENICNNLIYRTENGNAIITRCTTIYPEEIVIPDTIEGYPVTEIQTDAFYGCTQLKKVTLPTGLKKIGNSAFYMCEGLKEIVIPDGTTTIEEFAFFRCTNLQKFVIPASVDYIGIDAISPFYGEGFEIADLPIYIYGQSGSAAETYAIENNLIFIEVAPDGTENPDNKLIVKDNSIKVDNNNMLLTFGPDQTPENLKNKIINSNIEIVDKDGNELDKNSFIGTGCKIRIMDNDGKIVNEYTAIVPSDVDGNGEITASDARTTLRASAGLSAIEGVYETAADSDGNNELTASDARKILRKSAGLE